MGLFFCDKWQWTSSLVILVFCVFMGIPTLVSGATLRNHAVITLRSDDLEKTDLEKVLGFSGAGNKRPVTVASANLNPNQQQYLESQQHQQYQIQNQQPQSQQQILQQPVVDIHLTGGTLQTGADQSSSLLELGAALMPSSGGSPLQVSPFFSSSTPQRPPLPSPGTSPIHQIQYPSSQIPAAIQQQNIPSPPPVPSPEHLLAGHSPVQHLESSSQLEQQPFQETPAQSQPSSSTQDQQSYIQLEQPSPSPAPPQELSTVPLQQEESHFTPPQLPPAPEETEYLSSQQPHPPPEVQQVSTHIHHSSSSPNQQQSQQVITQQQHYSKPPHQEPIILEQHQSVVHTEPQSVPEHPQAPFVPPQVDEPVHVPLQQAPPQMPEAPLVPPQQAPQLSDEGHESPQLPIEVAATPSIAEPSIDDEQLESVETIPLEQSSATPDNSPSSVQEGEVPEAPAPLSFVLLPQNSINSPLQSNNFGLFNKPQPQEGDQLSSANQPQDQSTPIIDKPGSLIAQLSAGSLLANSIPSSASSDSNEDEPLSHEQSVVPSILGSTNGWGSFNEIDSGPTLVMDTSLTIGSAAAVSSTHTEALNLIGDHENPAIAEVYFASDAHHGVAGNTYQVSSGSTQGSQNSEGHINGGSSQMYELATMGEHNEVLVSGSSGSEAIGSVSQQSLADTITAETPVQQQAPIEMPLIELSPVQTEAEAEVSVHIPQIEPQPQIIETVPQHIEDVHLEIPQVEPQVIETAPQQIEDVPLEIPQIEPQVIETGPQQIEDVSLEIPQLEPQVIEISPQHIEDVPVEIPQSEPQVIEIPPQHIEDVPLEIPQVEPQVVEAAIVPQAPVPGPIPAQESPAYINQIAIVAPSNNLIHESQQELLQLLLSQPENGESHQRPSSDSNPTTEVVNMAHSGQIQVQHSSVNQVSNNLALSQQDFSKLQNDEKQLVEKISRAFLKQPNGMDQLPFISDAGKVVPEQEGLRAAMLQ